MSSATKIAGSVVTPGVSRRSHSPETKYYVCAHCLREIDTSHGEVVIECMGVALHEEHFTEYIQDEIQSLESYSNN